MEVGIFIIILFLFVATLLFTIVSLDNGVPKKVPCILGGLLIFFGGWFAISMSEPWRETNIIPCLVQEVKVKDGIGVIQTISWVEDNDENRLVNVNTKFGRAFQQGDIIFVKVHKSGWYFGIYWKKTREIEANLVGNPC